MDLSAEQILQRARAAGAGASSYTMSFNYGSDPLDPDPTHLSGRLSWDRSGHCVGHVAIAGKGSAELIVSDGTTWLKPDPRFAQAEFGPAAAALLAGKYLQGPVGDPHFDDLSASASADNPHGDLCQMGVYLQSIPDEGDEGATKRGTTIIGGVHTVEVMPVGKGASNLFIATDGTARLIRAGDQPGVCFTDYDKPVAVHLPAANQTVDVSRLPRR